MALLDMQTILTRQIDGTIEQTLTAATADVAVPTTKSIDLGEQGVTPRGNTPVQDFGAADGEFVVEVGSVDLTGATSVKAQLVEADNAALTSNVTVLAETPARVAALLVPGYDFKLGRPERGYSKRYIGCRLLPTGGACSGTFRAYFALEKGTA